MKNQPVTMKNHEKPPRTMKNHEKPWKTMNNHEKNLKNHEKPTWNHEKPWKTMKKTWKTNVEPWKTMKANLEPWKNKKKLTWNHKNNENSTRTPTDLLWSFPTNASFKSFIKKLMFPMKMSKTKRLTIILPWNQCRNRLLPNVYQSAWIQGSQMKAKSRYLRKCWTS